MTIYSNSRLSLFEDCPHKYKLHYIDRVETERAESVEAFLGSRVHETLEKLYRDLQFQKDDSLEELIDYYKNEWEKKWNDAVVIVKKEYKEKNYLDMGVKYITDYYQRFKPFNQLKTISIEQEIIFALDEDENYKIKGKLDRLTESDTGVYNIHDYKTSINLPPIEKIHKDRQLALYAIGVKQKYPDVRKVNLIWHYLAYDKDYYSTRTDEQLEEVRNQTIKLIDDIEKEEVFPAKPSYLCEWCEYKPVCKQWSHKYKLEGKPANEYLKDPGVQLVNKYADLYEKRKKINDEINTELEKLKDAIIEFAHRENVDVVFGSNKKARISVSEKISFPGKNDKERDELNKIIKEVGLWNDLSELDIYALNRKINSGDIPQDVLNKIKKFQKIEKSEKISLSKIKDSEK